MAADPNDTPYSHRTEVSTRLELLKTAVTDDHARRALCNRYAPVVFTAYLGFFLGRPNGRPDALDLTHAFLIHFFLEPREGGLYRFANYIDLAEAERGRFLAYTLKAADNYRLDAHRRATNPGHGGGRKPVEVDADPDRFADFIASQDLDPAAAVELAYTLSLLWQAAVRVSEQLAAKPAKDPEASFHDALAAGKEPNVSRLATAGNVTEKHIRKGWEAFRADRALVPYLLNPPPPYSDLATHFGVREESLKTRFTRLRGDVRVALQRIMKDELDVADPKTAAAEVTKMLDVLGRMMENPK